MLLAHLLAAAWLTIARADRCPPILKMLARYKREYRDGVFALSWLERQPYVVKYGDGKILDANDRPITGLGHCVVDAEGELYFRRVRPDEVFHHSSFLNGKDAEFAGYLEFNDAGKLIAVSGHSGHYRPTPQHVEAFLRKLRDKNIPLKDVEINFFDRPLKFIHAEDIIGEVGEAKDAVEVLRRMAAQGRTSDLRERAKKELTENFQLAP